MKSKALSLDGLDEACIARAKREFWAKVNKTDGCWEWTGRAREYSYGRFGFAGKKLRAHRVSWVFEYGPLPEGSMCVLHRCDNKKCVRPDHLFLGTRKDNAVDAASKGRNTSQVYPGIRQGEKGGNCRLEAIDVLEIRRLAKEGHAPTEIAKKFGISRAHVRLIRDKKRWACIA